MTIDFPCPECGALCHAPDDYGGGNARCASCGADVDIPPVSTLPQELHELSRAAGTVQEGIDESHAARGSDSRVNRRVTIIIAVMIAGTFAALGALALRKTQQRVAEDRVAQQIAEATKLIEEGKIREAAFALDYAAKQDLSPEAKEEVDTLRASIRDELQELDRRAAQVASARKDAQARDRQARLAHEREKRRRARSRSADNLRAVGGAFGGLVWAFGLALIACIFLGMGQIVVAFRDIAVNTYLMTGRDMMGTSRTAVAAGQFAPRYRFIPFLALVFDVAAGVLLFGAVLVVLFVLWNL